MPTQFGGKRRKRTGKRGRGNGTGTRGKKRGGNPEMVRALVEMGPAIALAALAKQAKEGSLPFPFSRRSPSFMRRRSSRRRGRGRSFRRFMPY